MQNLPFHITEHISDFLRSDDAVSMTMASKDFLPLIDVAHRKYIDEMKTELETKLSVLRRAIVAKTFEQLDSKVIDDGDFSHPEVGRNARYSFIAEVSPMWKHEVFDNDGDVFVTKVKNFYVEAHVNHSWTESDVNYSDMQWTGCHLGYVYIQTNDDTFSWSNEEYGFVDTIEKPAEIARVIGYDGEQRTMRPEDLDAPMSGFTLKPVGEIVTDVHAALDEVIQNVFSLGNLPKQIDIIEDAFYLIAKNFCNKFRSRGWNELWMESGYAVDQPDWLFVNDNVCVEKTMNELLELLPGWNVSTSGRGRDIVFRAEMTSDMLYVAEYDVYNGQRSYSGYNLDGKSEFTLFV